MFLSVLAFIAALTLSAQVVEDRYIEVTGTAEVEIVPDEIHYVIQIREYFREEFDGKSKPEEYRTKVGIERIERELMQALTRAGIESAAIRTQEVGDNWRKPGQDFLVSKTFDITLHDFGQIDRIVQNVDTKGINAMYIGELKNRDMLTYHRQGKIAALQAARDKAAYLVEALGKKLGGVVRIVEADAPGAMLPAQSNVMASDAASYDRFRTIHRKYSMLVRFEIAD